MLKRFFKWLQPLFSSEDKGYPSGSKMLDESSMAPSSQLAYISLELNNALVNPSYHYPVTDGMNNRERISFIIKDFQRAYPGLEATFDYTHSHEIIITVKSIGGRVQRDRLDGIRYNRVYIALYWDNLGSLNAQHHDIFFNLEEHKVSGGYQVSISDNREFGGDTVKLVKGE